MTADTANTTATAAPGSVTTGAAKPTGPVEAGVSVFHRPRPLESFEKYILNIIRNVSWSALVVGLDIGIGIWGYMYFGDMPFAESYANATMVLSGVGATEGLKTEAGQYFEGTYSLVCSFVFYGVVGFIVTPFLQRFLHCFHIKTYSGSVSEHKN